MAAMAMFAAMDASETAAGRRASAFSPVQPRKRVRFESPDCSSPRAEADVAPPGTSHSASKRRRGPLPDVGGMSGSGRSEGSGPLRGPGQPEAGPKGATASRRLAPRSGALEAPQEAIGLSPGTGGRTPRSGEGAQAAEGGQAGDASRQPFVAPLIRSEPFTAPLIRSEPFTAPLIRSEPFMTPTRPPQPPAWQRPVPGAPVRPRGPLYDVFGVGAHRGQSEATASPAGRDVRQPGDGNLAQQVSQPPLPAPGRLTRQRAVMPRSAEEALRLRRMAVESLRGEIPAAAPAGGLLQPASTAGEAGAAAAQPPRTDSEGSASSFGARHVRNLLAVREEAEEGGPASEAGAAAEPEESAPAAPTAALLSGIEASMAALLRGEDVAGASWAHRPSLFASEPDDGLVALERELASSMREHIHFRRVHPVAAAEVAAAREAARAGAAGATDRQAVDAWMRTEALLRALRLQREACAAQAALLRAQHEHIVRSLLMCTLGRVLECRRRVQPGLSHEVLSMQQEHHIQWLMRAAATDFLGSRAQRLQAVRDSAAHHGVDLRDVALWPEVVAFYESSLHAFRAPRARVEAAGLGAVRNGPLPEAGALDQRSAGERSEAGQAGRDGGQRRRPVFGVRGEGAGDQTGHAAQRPRGGSS